MHHRRTAILLAVLTVGCSGEAVAPPERPLVTLDLSEDQSAERVEWHDFDPGYGAIDGEHRLEFKFDAARSFVGDVDLISFARIWETAETIWYVRVNLPPMTATQVSDALNSLVADWNLRAEHVPQRLPRMLSDPLRRGLLISEGEAPLIEIGLHSSFDDGAPYSLTITWYWGDPVPPDRE